MSDNYNQKRMITRRTIQKIAWLSMFMNISLAILQLQALQALSLQISSQQLSSSQSLSKEPSVVDPSAPSADTLFAYSSMIASGTKIEELEQEAR